MKSFFKESANFFAIYSCLSAAVAFSAEPVPPDLVPEPDKLVQCFQPSAPRWAKWSFRILRDATARLVAVGNEKLPRVELDLRFVQHECVKDEWGDYNWVARPWPVTDRAYVNSYENYKDSAFDEADVSDPRAIDDIFNSPWFIDSYVWLKGAHTAPFGAANDGWRTRLQIPVREALTRKTYAEFKKTGIAKLDMVLGLSSESVAQAYRFSRFRGSYVIIDRFWLSGTYRAQVELDRKILEPKTLVFVPKNTPKISL
jgi:hypothetical protein